MDNATSPSEGVASLPPIPHSAKDAPAARPITTDEGVTSPTTRVAITDTASLEGVTNLCSSKQDSAAATERTAVDLFSGCGGLAHAARLLGFRHLALIESNERCATTLKLNGFTNVDYCVVSSARPMHSGPNSLGLRIQGAGLVSIVASGLSK